MKSIGIRSFSGQYFPALPKNSEYWPSETFWRILNNALNRGVKFTWKQNFIRSAYVFSPSLRRNLPPGRYIPLADVRTDEGTVIFTNNHHFFQSVNRNWLDGILFSCLFYAMNSNFYLQGEIIISLITLIILQNVKILDSKTYSFVNYYI